MLLVLKKKTNPRTSIALVLSLWKDGLCLFFSHIIGKNLAHFLRNHISNIQPFTYSQCHCLNLLCLGHVYGWTEQTIIMVHKTMMGLLSSILSDLRSMTQMNCSEEEMLNLLNLQQNMHKPSSQICKENCSWINKIWVLPVVIKYLFFWW